MSLYNMIEKCQIVLEGTHTSISWFLSPPVFKENLVSAKQIRSNQQTNRVVTVLSTPSQPPPLQLSLIRCCRAFPPSDNSQISSSESHELPAAKDNGVTARLDSRLRASRDDR